MAMIETVPAFTLPSSVQFQQRAARFFSGLISSYRRHRTEKQLARLAPETLTDIGVPHDHVSLAAGELTRHPNVIRLKISRV